jgi:hypothetical protein
VTTEDLQILARMNLRRLSLRLYVPGIMSLISQLTGSLTSLEFISDDDIQSLVNVPNLTHLKVVAYKHRLTTAELRHISALSLLESLELASVFGDIDPSVLAPLPRLRSLVIEAFYIEGDFYQKLRWLVGVERFSLAQVESLDSLKLRSVCEMPSLRTLVLERNNVTTRGIADLLLAAEDSKTLEQIHVVRLNNVDEDETLCRQAQALLPESFRPTKVELYCPNDRYPDRTFGMTKLYGPHIVV